VAERREEQRSKVAKTVIQKRLDYLRGEIKAERISYEEIAELQSLAEHIDPSDTELLQWAGVPEFPELPELGQDGDRD
jgi:hypothetical protein